MSIETRSRQYGIVFDHWRIKEFLGSGSNGKSAVFRLVHTNTSSVESALKVISLIEKRGNLDSLSDSRKAEYENVKQKCKKNAEQEVLLMNNLQGQGNVVHYQDHTFVDWSDDTGFGYDLLIRMELQKEDLRSKIEAEYAFSQENVLKIGKEICSALVLCHRKNILHRDIKPENIFCDKDGNYKLGDFGVSRILSAAPMSKASTGVCTPEYAAPEQLSGVYDTRVDIYSLGLVLYELSNTNRLPFSSSSFISEVEVQERLHGKPLPVPCNASEELGAVILKACAFNPAERYQTAEEFLAELDSLAAVSSIPKDKLQSVRRDTQKATPVRSGNATQYAAPDARKRNNSRDAGYANSEKQEKIGYQPVEKHKNKFSLGLIACVAAIFVCILFFLLREEHGHTWIDATCIAPRTCEECHETEGVALGHTWSDATCTAARTCNSCGETEGAALGHAWSDATCTAARTCNSCGETEGAALGHAWINATYENPKTCSICGATEGEPIPDIVAGDILTMGYYGNEEIEWIVLEFDPATNQVLLISKYCLDVVPFYMGDGNGTWENSILRAWLNNEFISKAFDQEERTSILTKQISNSGNDTTDRVFVLSAEEAGRYLINAKLRQSEPTSYCREQGCYDPVEYAMEHGTEYEPESVGHTCWWLRTAGIDNERTAVVFASGTISTYGAIKSSDDVAVRPAMWVQLG